LQFASFSTHVTEAGFFGLHVSYSFQKLLDLLSRIVLKILILGKRDRVKLVTFVIFEEHNHLVAALSHF
jgi:hypothetical protein